VISTADFDSALTRPRVGVGLFRGQGGAFLRAMFSFPSPGMRDLLRGPIASWHVSQMLFSAREHLASDWLDLAEGRLRLDRLNRNGGSETFFPWACHPAQRSARGPRFAHSSRGPRKSHRRHPPLRFGPGGCGVDRLRLSDRHRGRGGRGLENSKEK
jgi:hypothetical protein